MRGAAVLAISASLILGGCVSDLAERQLRSGLVDSGIPDSTASCMASRMVDRLTVRQLLKLKAFEGEKRTLGEYVQAVRRVDDPKVIAVTASSAALCAAGVG